MWTGISPLTGRTRDAAIARSGATDITWQFGWLLYYNIFVGRLHLSSGPWCGVSWLGLDSILRKNVWKQTNGRRNQTPSFALIASMCSRGPIYAESGHNVNLHLLMACLASLSIITLCWTPPVHARTPSAGSMYQMRLLIGCSQSGLCSRLLIGCSEIGSCSICQSGQLIWTEVIDVI